MTYLNIVKNIFLFSIFFYILTILIHPFQLIGLSDYIFHLTPIYSFFDNFRLEISGYEGGNDLLFNAFSFLIAFVPLLFLTKDPINLVYIIYYLCFLSWFLISYSLLFKLEKQNIKNFILYFLLFFSSATILFQYSLNFNGFASTYISIPFLLLAYYFAFIKQEYNKAILFYLPLFTVKIEYWFLIIFFIFSIFIYSKKYKYLILSILFIPLFFAYKDLILPYLTNYSETGMNASIHGRYNHIFGASSIKELFLNIINMPMLYIKLALMFLFFLPFVFLIDIFKITKKDWFIFLFLLAPTFGYCLLATQIPMAYWTHEHYSLPVLPLIFLLILKYGNFNKYRILGYLLANLLIFTLILSNKQPWQYKYYVDEKQLKSKIMPLLKLKNKDYLLVEDRTGIYFTPYKVDWIDSINKTKKRAKYIILNLRYQYLINNVKKHNTKTIESYKYLNNISRYLKNYGVIYEKYPFIVLSYENGEKLNINRVKLDKWDEISLNFNKWF